MSELPLEMWLVIIAISCLFCSWYLSTMSNEDRHIDKQERDQNLLGREQRTREIRTIVREELANAKNPSITSLTVY